MKGVWSNISSVYSTNPYCTRLLLVDFGGTFVCLFALLCLSFFVFLLEIISLRFADKKVDELEIFELPLIRYDSRISLQARQIIELKYAEIFAVIDNNEQTIE
jgi:hypothetical protein